MKTRLAVSLLLLVCLSSAPARANEDAGADELPKKTRPLIIQAVGDLNLAGNAEPTVRAKGYDWCFDGTRALIAEGDLNIANLETAVTSRGQKADKQFTFRMPAHSLDAVKKAGFSLVSLANNHTLDYGEQGLFDTFEALQSRGIAYAGAGKNVASGREPAIVEVSGVKVGFLSYSLTFPKSFWADKDKPGTIFGHEKWVRDDIARLRSQADIVLVAFHWGAEKRTTPKDYQLDVARASIDAGADAVIGHHPHVLQGIEIINGKPVLYSLGNYAFGSSSNSARDSALARFTIEEGQIRGLELVPLHVHNKFVDYNPQVSTGEQLERTLVALESMSSALGTRTHRRDGRLVIELTTVEASK